MTTSDDEGRRALNAYVGALVDELVRGGVHHFCVCPGSRSTPLALIVARHPGARLWMHLDERSAGFFGLGLAKARREPVALVCTSGTAAANFLPAVVEAYHGRVPLVVLTADRPHELRDRGAPQTIDQCRLYGTHVKWFVDLAEPDESPTLVRYARATASRAVAVASRGPAGPVHLNCPFREPLVPGTTPSPPTPSPNRGRGVFGADASAKTLPPRLKASPGEGGEEGRPEGVEDAGILPGPAVASGRRLPSAEIVDDLAADLLASPRGLIVCGPGDDSRLADAASHLAASLDYPILADPLSGVRRGDHDRALVMDCYDVVLREPSFVERFAPDVVLRFGSIPTSKAVSLYLHKHRCRQVLVDGDAGWNDPDLDATDILHVDPPALCRALGEAVERRRTEVESSSKRSGWAALWLAADRCARRVVSACLARIEEPFEGKVFTELAEILPAGATLYAGNSMPVRDLDAFFPAGERPIRFLANRGVNGIDGVVSSALGARAGTEGPLVLVIGDLSLYHDLNGLLAAKRHGLSLTIVLLNNDGGGIFSFLPQADEPEHFETLFGTPHGLDFRPAVEMYGGRFRQTTAWDAFRSALRTSLDTPGLDVIEVPTDRARNLALHRQIWRDAASAIAELAGQGVGER